MSSPSSAATGRPTLSHSAMSIAMNPRRRRFIGIAAAASALALAPLSLRRASAAITPTTWQGVALGADAELRLYHPDPRAARQLIAQALGELHRLEGIFSLYRDDSALARLNRQGYLADPPADLLRLLGDSLRYSRLTGGVFDPTVQPLWQLYAGHFARAGAAAQGPSEAELAQALARVSYRAVTLDSRRIELQGPGMGITLNGIAQGYITDCITRLLRQGGLERALVDMGEIRGLDSRASPGDWQVGLADPRAPQRILAAVPVRNQALATSGGYGTALDLSLIHILRRILRHGRRRMAVHAEDEARLRERKSIVLPSGDVRLHPHWRDVESALIATRRIVRLAAEAHRRLHVLHVSSAEEIAFLAEHKRRVSVEVTPHHLTLHAPDCYERLGSLAQMNPPVREPRHQDALWQGIRDGVVDVIGSDHAPHTLEEKARRYPQSPSGMTGVQTLLPLMLDHVHAGRLSLPRLADLTSAGPARLFGLEGKGRIALGYDADFSIVDLQACRTIRNDWIASVSGWTPYDGLRVTGWPIHTVVRGHAVVRDEALADAAPPGQPLRFLEATPASPSLDS